MSNIKAIKGMKDLLDNEAMLYEKVINVCSSVAQNYGYSFINLPHLENTPLFRRSVGESSDIVGKEMYEFVDKGGNDVCLRPEGTAGSVRAFIEKKLDKAKAKKRWFYHGSMFRYERPQKGRLREFHQFGIECFNEPSVYEDASVIMILHDIFKKLDIKTTLKLNSLGTAQTLLEYKKSLVDFSKDKCLCEDCLRRKELNPIRMLDCKNESCQKELENAPKLSSFLDDESKSDFIKLQKILDDCGVAYELDERLVRGLDYYCKTAFEFVSDEIGAQSAVAGGGRYDRLVDYLGGESSYGVGFALGVERIMVILENKEQTIEPSGIYACVLNDSYLNTMYIISHKLRQNYKVTLSYDSKKLAKHLKDANTSNARYFMAIGEEEFKEQKVLIKDLISGNQELVSFDDLNKYDFRG